MGEVEGWSNAGRVKGLGVGLDRDGLAQLKGSSSGGDGRGCRAGEVEGRGWLQGWTVMGRCS